MAHSRGLWVTVMASTGLALALAGALGVRLRNPRAARQESFQRELAADAPLATGNRTTLSGNRTIP